MNEKKLKRIINLFEESNIAGLEIKSLFGSIKLKKNEQSLRAAVYVPEKPVSELKPAAEKSETSPKIIDFNDLTEIKSPMVGVFYSASSPESEPFVKKGSKVKKGDIICIIEAMKVMNEITSDYEGEVVDICAENGQLVEYSQVMFKLKK